LAATSLACSSVARYSAVGNAARVQELLDQGESPDGTDYKSRHAIELAVHFQRADVVRVLVAGGADLDVQTSRRMPPLHYAALRGYSEIVEILIAGGARLDVVDARGHSALGWAIRARKWRAATLLADAGAKVHGHDERRRANKHLIRAVRTGDIELTGVLVSAGADPDARIHRGNSARQLAKAHFSPAQIARAFGGPVPEPVVVAAPALLEPARETPPRTASRTVPPGLDFGRYHALVIGNDAYENLPQLRTAIRDADAVEQMLRNHYGYAVTRLTNASRAETLRSLTEFRRNLSADDNLLIYYAGHGWLDPEADRGYWLPVDADVDDFVNWIDNAAITSVMRAMQAKHVMVVADSCYSGNLTRGIQAISKQAGYIERLASRRARVVITSGGLEPVLDGGGSGHHSVFASAFLEVLEENRGVLEGHELYTRLRRPVTVQSDQVPRYADLRTAGHEGGDFLFVRRN
jgi:ankyrin repeat protein